MRPPAAARARSAAEMAGCAKAAVDVSSSATSDVPSRTNRRELLTVRIIMAVHSFVANRVMDGAAGWATAPAPAAVLEARGAPTGRVGKPPESEETRGR